MKWGLKDSNVDWEGGEHGNYIATVSGEAKTITLTTEKPYFNNYVVDYLVVNGKDIPKCVDWDEICKKGGTDYSMTWDWGELYIKSSKSNFSVEIKLLENHSGIDRELELRLRHIEDFGKWRIVQTSLSDD